MKLWEDRNRWQDILKIISAFNQITHWRKNLLIQIKSILPSLLQGKGIRVRASLAEAENPAESNGRGDWVLQNIFGHLILQGRAQWGHLVFQGPALWWGGVRPQLTYVWVWEKLRPVGGWDLGQAKLLSSFLISYASSSTLYPRQWVSDSVIVSN